MSTNNTTIPSTNYTMAEAAEICSFKSRVKLFEFLRKYNIIQEQYPAAEFIQSNYFIVGYTSIRNQGRIIKTVPQIYVTEKGIKFIKNLHKIITKDFYVSFHTNN